MLMFTVAHNMHCLICSTEIKPVLSSAWKENTLLK
uniref:Uncharacterized protein n=1 Tax=Anguilla anguilla TaxID=7936 RepID=A0A0E9V414_ANGAN